MVSSHIAVVVVVGGPRNTRENETVLYQFFLELGFSDIPLTFFLSTSENGTFGIPGTYSMCD